MRGGGSNGLSRTNIPFIDAVTSSAALEVGPCLFLCFVAARCKMLGGAEGALRLCCMCLDDLWAWVLGFGSTVAVGSLARHLSFLADHVACKDPVCSSRRLIGDCKLSMHVEGGGSSYMHSMLSQALHNTDTMSDVTGQRTDAHTVTFLTHVALHVSFGRWVVGRGGRPGQHVHR